MGFCLFNNVAVAAAHARALGAERVAIVDYDVHHGNGTQHIFEADPVGAVRVAPSVSVLPGHRRGDETGAGDGRGFTVNLPLEAGAIDDDYRRRVRRGGRSGAAAVQARPAAGVGRLRRARTGSAGGHAPHDGVIRRDDDRSWDGWRKSAAAGGWRSSPKAGTTFTRLRLARRRGEGSRIANLRAAVAEERRRARPRPRVGRRCKKGAGAFLGGSSAHEEMQPPKTRKHEETLALFVSSCSAA